MSSWEQLTFNPNKVHREPANIKNLPPELHPALDATPGDLSRLAQVDHDYNQFINHDSSLIAWERSLAQATPDEISNFAQKFTKDTPSSVVQMFISDSRLPVAIKNHIIAKYGNGEQRDTLLKQLEANTNYPSPNHLLLLHEIAETGSDAQRNRIFTHHAIETKIYRMHRLGILSTLIQAGNEELRRSIFKREILSVQQQNHFQEMKKLFQSNLLKKIAPDLTDDDRRFYIDHMSGNSLSMKKLAGFTIKGAVVPGLPVGFLSSLRNNSRFDPHGLAYGVAGGALLGMSANAYSQAKEQYQAYQTRSEIARIHDKIESGIRREPEIQRNQGDHTYPPLSSDEINRLEEGRRSPRGSYQGGSSTAHSARGGMSR